MIGLFKKNTALFLVGVMMFSLSSCGSSGESTPAQAPPASVDPMIAAEEQFNSALRSLSDAQSWLLELIPEAEAVLESVATEDVGDPQVIEELNSILGEAKAAQGFVAPEMGSGIEKVREQAQAIQEQANNAFTLCDSLDSAMSYVAASQQSLKDQKLRDSVAAKEVYTGKTSTANGYEAEYKVSVTGWIKASDSDSLQLAWEGVAKEGDVMPSLSQFHNTTNDGFTEANAAVAFGQISFRNITQGFDITEESPVTFGLALSTSFGKYSTNTPKIYFNYSNGPKTYSFNDYPAMSPLMKSNAWGPVVFMIVCPNVITPNDPTGDALNDFELYFNNSGVGIVPSW